MDENQSQSTSNFDKSKRLCIRPIKDPLRTLDPVRPVGSVSGSENFGPLGRIRVWIQKNRVRVRV